ncbi:MAG: D-cysteine desulfhydrase family protein [Anaerolineales bacterium]|nr:D-cysteine desulfhydrase family protein [Anaerolineales bacterium]
MKPLPRTPLAQLPTPLQPMPRLSAALGGPQLWVKRDDQTGLALGGNKTRKLETLCAAALEAGAGTLLTAGAIQSNHCRQTAAAAASLGLACTLVLAGEPPALTSGNLLLDGLFGAEIIWTTFEERPAVLQAAEADLRAAGKRPYLIPYGGSSPLGAAAYAYALEELLGQGLAPDSIVFATSSGGTQAGLVAGARLLGYGGRILGISVDERAADLQARVAPLAVETAELLGGSIQLAPEDVLVNDDYLGEGYAVMGAAEAEAIRLFARHEGLLVDPVYTGRAAAGLIDLIRQGYFNKDENVLFWHTGGAPALFAERYQQDLHDG